MYGGRSTEVFHCPRGASGFAVDPQFGSGQPPGWASLQDEVRLKPGGSFFMSYGYNVWGAFAGNNPNTGLGFTWVTRSGEKPRNPAVIKPSEMIAVRR